MATQKKNAWKLERASVSRPGKNRPRSNKYSPNDGSRPKAGTRQRIWVGGYKRADGVQVAGYYRSVQNG